MRALWQRLIQSIFGKPYTLQGNWLGREEFDIDDWDTLEDWDCELCREYDIIDE